jgi:hypothetical protein
MKIPSSEIKKKRRRYTCTRSAEDKAPSLNIFIYNRNAVISGGALKIYDDIYIAYKWGFFAWHSIFFLPFDATLGISPRPTPFEIKPTSFARFLQGEGEPAHRVPINYQKQNFDHFI